MIEDIKSGEKRLKFPPDLLKGTGILPAFSN
jgi:hypothetical protein